MAQTAMPVLDLAARTRLFALDPGLYLVRYAERMGAGSTPPTLSLCAAPASGPAGQVDFFAGSTLDGALLTRPGDCMVVRVRGTTANIAATVFAAASDMEADVRLRVDRVDESGARGLAPTEPPEPAPPAARDTRGWPIAVRAHIEGRGEVAGAPGSWVGNPYGKARLEGFALEWEDRPEDVDIRSTCVIEGMGRTPPAGVGEFVGTRVRGAPVRCLTLTLVGARAGLFRLAVQAAFSRSGPQAPAPSGIEIQGPDGNDYLTALRVMAYSAAAMDLPAGERPTDGGCAPQAPRDGPP